MKIVHNNKKMYKVNQKSLYILLSLFSVKKMYFDRVFVGIKTLF